MRKNLLSVFTVVFIFLFLSCKEGIHPPRSEFVLGTVCTINAFDDGTRDLYDELFGRLYKIDSEFSVNRVDSEISQINDNAGKMPVSVTGDVLYVIQTAIKYAKRTDGAFDPTIGPLVKLWGINTDHARVPEKKEIEDALTLVNWHNVEINKSKTVEELLSEKQAGTVFLTKKGMALDLGGIAKGYAADEMVEILQSKKIKRAIVDLGGNIFVYGKKEDGSLWKVGIKNPENPEGGEPAFALSLSNSTVVTSGVYERFFIQDGKRYHHIINPKTGYPAESGLLSSTVVCESSIDADALSTSVFVLGEEKGFALLKKISEEKILKSKKNIVPYAIFIGADNHVSASSFFDGRMIPCGDSFTEIEFK